MPGLWDLNVTVEGQAAADNTYVWAGPGIDTPYIHIDGAAGGVGLGVYNNPPEEQDNY